VRYWFKILMRVIKRDKLHSLLVILGLAVGFASAIIVFLFARDQFTYEKFNLKYERTYRYGVGMTIGGVSNRQISSNAAVGPLLKENLTGIESYARFAPVDEILVKIGENSYNESDFLWADNDILSIFTVSFLAGDPKIALQEPYSIVLTRSLALKYFGSTDIVNKEIMTENAGIVRVTAVIEDYPANSHLSFTALISLRTLEATGFIRSDPAPSDLGSGMFLGLYLLFRENYSPRMFYDEFHNYYDKHLKHLDMMQYEPIIEPIGDILLNSMIQPDLAATNRRFLYAICSIGIFIMLLACINYINLATARSAGRAREIGLKKVIGAGIRQLRMQFLYESVFFSVAALFLSFVFIEIVLTFTSLNRIVGADLKLDLAGEPSLFFISLLFAIFIGMISGFYPAIYLAALSPLKVFRSDARKEGTGIYLRNILVVLQFMISIGAITLTLLMNSQIDFLRRHNLGFDQENVAVIRTQDEHLISRLPVLKNEISKHHFIQSAALSSTTPGFRFTGWAFEWESSSGKMETHAFRQLIAEPDYFRTLGISFSSGRNFLSETHADNREVVVNQSLVDEMGWDDPIGKICRYGEVVGVAENFNYSSLHGEILPLYILNQPEYATMINIRIKSEHAEQAVKFLKDTWKKFAGNTPLNLSFLDERFNAFYRQDEQQKKMIQIFSLVCILISIIGFLGLTSYTMLQKTKEVAIRKIHGAQVVNIMYMLYKRVIFIVALSCLIAFPLTWIIFRSWQNHYAYRIEIGILHFIVSFMIIMLLGLLISGYHTLRIAVINPVKIMRFE